VAGGYELVDPRNDEQIRTLARQIAATDLNHQPSSAAVDSFPTRIDRGDDEGIRWRRERPA